MPTALRLGWPWASPRCRSFLASRGSEATNGSGSRGGGWRGNDPRPHSDASSPPQCGSKSCFLHPGAKIIPARKDQRQLPREEGLFPPAPSPPCGLQAGQAEFGSIPSFARMDFLQFQDALTFPILLLPPFLPIPPCPSGGIRGDERPMATQARAPWLGPVPWRGDGRWQRLLRRVAASSQTCPNIFSSRSGQWEAAGPAGKRTGVLQAQGSCSAPQHPLAPGAFEGAWPSQGTPLFWSLSLGSPLSPSRAPQERPAFAPLVSKVPGQLTPCWEGAAEYGPPCTGVS